MSIRNPTIEFELISGVHYRLASDFLAYYKATQESIYKELLMLMEQQYELLTDILGACEYIESPQFLKDLN